MINYGKVFFESSLHLFTYYKNLGERALEQIPDDKLFWQFNEDSNSAATIVKHLSGNMLSRWSDFMNSDGEKNVYIRNQSHHLIEAISRQLTHYASHIGQLIYLGKMLHQGSWKSLSIPKGASRSFNKEKFGQPKNDGKFTNDYLKETKK